MKTTVKKMIATLVAMLMLLTTVTVSAGTIYVDLTVDQEAAANLAGSFGVPEEQMSMVTPIISLVNAIGVKVALLDDGGQVDLDLNGKQALTVGFATDEQGITLVSDLFPSYLVTVSNETLGQFMETFMANMPGAGGEAGTGMMDMEAMGELFGSYFARIMEAGQNAATVGEPVPGTYEFEGYTFDTMAPVTVDMKKIGTEVKAILEEMLANEAVVSMIQGYGQSFGGDFDIEQVKEFLLNMDQYYPEEVTCEFYNNSDGSQTFYMVGESSREGAEEPYAGYTMLYVDQANMSMNYWDNEQAMNISFLLSDGAMRADFNMGEMYMGFHFYTEAGESTRYHCDLFFMDPQNPLLCVDVTISDVAERTLLPVDNGTKTVITLEEIMGGQSEAATGFMTEIMTTGLGSLMGTLTEAVPEMADLISMMSSMSAGGAAQEASMAPQESKQIIQLGTSGYTIETDESYVEGERTEDEKADDLVAYYHSDKSLLDFDIYQFSKEGYPENLADFVEQEAEQYNATSVQTDGDIFGVPFGRYYANEVYEGVEYETVTYVLEDNGQYVEIAFWLDGIDAGEEAFTIINSLTYNAA